VAFKLMKAGSESKGLATAAAMRKLAPVGHEGVEMKTWSMTLVAMVALLVSLNVAQAAKGPKPLTGVISKIDGASITVTPHKPKGSTETPADVTVTTTDATTVLIKGEKKTVADLTVGLKVRITLDADGKTATAITSGKGMPAASAPATTNP
jgi:hypothetical protein